MANHNGERSMGRTRITVRYGTEAVPGTCAVLRVLDANGRMEDVCEDVWTHNFNLSKYTGRSGRFRNPRCYLIWINTRTRERARVINAHCAVTRHFSLIRPSRAASHALMLAI